MARRRSLLVIAVGLTVALAGCAPAEPDWRAAQAAADEYLETASAAADALGSASGQMGPRTGGDSNGGRVTLTFPGPTRVDHVDLACFGDGEATMSVEARDASGSTGLEVTVPCDGEPTRAELPEPADRITDISVGGELRSGGGAVFAAVVTGEVD